VVLVLAGLVLLYVLRRVILDLMLVALGFLGVLLAIGLIAVGLALVLWFRRAW
jgi:hypothetical protein